MSALPGLKYSGLDFTGLDLVKLEQRFMSFVSPEPMSGCWLWTGAVNEDGYGRIALRPAGKYWTIAYAHRLSLKLLGGVDPIGLEACHRCDFTACVNPAHLFAGTHRDNMYDCIAKGRRHHRELDRCCHGHDLQAPKGRLKDGGCRLCHAAVMARYLGRVRERRLAEAEVRP